MAELSNLEWFIKEYCEPVVVHDTKDGSPDNDQKHPEAESQVIHVMEI